MPIEVVTVGDCPLDERWRGRLAAREAMMNAAKFAGGDEIDVYAEVGAERIEVFVRDRGVGFDPQRVPATATACATRSSSGWRAHGGRAEIRIRAGRRGPRSSCTRGRGDDRERPARVVLVDDHSLFRSGVRRRARRPGRGRRRGRRRSATRSR